MRKETNNETSKRLDILHRKHYNWLFSVAFKVSKCKITSEDLIQELYIYLLERNDTNLFYEDSYNLQYCRSFIMSRFYNLIKVENRWDTLREDYDEEEKVYDVEFDMKLERAHKDVLDELQKMKRMKGWSSAMLAEMYFFGNMTFDELSSEIGISKSTAFLNVKKVKQRLKDNIENPFKNGKEGNN